MNLLKISHYRILKRLGSGATADVYLAEDTTLKRKVALKILNPALTQNLEQVRRFEQEAQWASILNHPNVITIYEIGEAEGSRFIATEYVEGDTLREKMERGPMSPVDAVGIAHDVASALRAAHEAWIVHRDIKPENIMIRTDGYLKVLDFGFAKLTQGGTALTQPRMVIGTLRYLAPEQVAGIAVDPRTDLWSLGVVLYEMVAGVPPFAGSTIVELFDAIKHTEPPALGVVRSDVPDDLDAIVTRALGKEMDSRYQSAAEMLSDLRELREELRFRERASKPWRV